MNKKFLISAFILIVLAWLALDDLVEDWDQVEGSLDNLGKFWEESLWPPDTDVWGPEFWNDGTVRQANGEICEPDSIQFFCSKAWHGISETIKMAFVATLAGFVIAVPLSSLAANNLTPMPIALISRITLAGLRSLPSLIWAILFVVAIGLGTLSGILAMTVYTIGYLGKLQYEAFEGIQNSPLESGMAMGLTSSERLYYIVIPESGNELLSQLMFMFEYNVRHGTVLGLVGAGGIGMYIDTYLKVGTSYDAVFALLIVIFVVVVLIDLISMAIRSFVTEEGDVKRPSWLTILLPPSKAAEYHHNEADSDQHN